MVRTGPVHDLTEHLSPAEVAEFVALEVGPGELLRLHVAGCTPEQLVAYRAAGLTDVWDVIRLRGSGWSPAYLAATGVEPDVALGYLACGVTSPSRMRRLVTAGALPGAIRVYVPSNTFCSAVASVEPLPWSTVTVDGAFGPLRFVVADGALEPATTEVIEALHDESSLEELGWGVPPSPALRLFREWQRGIEADWGHLAAVLGFGGSGATVRLRWLRSVLDAEFEPGNGYAVALPPLAPPAPCWACIERQEFVRSPGAVLDNGRAGAAVTSSR